MARTAAILGATGLIGGKIFEILMTEIYYDQINIISRRPLEITHPKVAVRVVDFQNEQQFRDALRNTDTIFCAIGTTRKKVGGDMEAYRKVDYDIPVNAALYGRTQGCSQFVLVSSAGADSRKKNFYLKLKGEVEDKLETLGFPSLLIFRPSLLLGEREEKRSWEGLMQGLSGVLSFLLPAKFKPVAAASVARAMVRESVKNPLGTHILYYAEIMNNQK